MRKRIKVHKNHVFITMVIIFLVMIGVAALTGSFVLNATLTTFTRDCKAVYELSFSLAEATQKDIEEKGNTIQFYRDILLAADNWETPILLAQLKKFERQAEFEAMAFMDNKGNIISSRTDAFSKTDIEKITLEVKKPNQSLFLIPTEDKLVYAAVLSRRNGVLLGEISADLCIEELAGGERVAEEVLYILDENNEVVLYCEGLGKAFQYSSIPKKLFFNANMDFKQFFRTENYLWYERPIQADNHREWKFLLGKTASPSEDTIRLMYQMLMLVACIMAVYFVLMVLVLLTQALSNRKLTKMAYLDLVIEWPNWNKFIIDASRMLYRQKKKNYAMVTLDVRKFRVISDIDGYQNDEQVLRQMADVFRAVMRKKELFTRVAIDEFALLLRYINQEELLERIRLLDEKLKNSIRIQGISFSVGIYYVNNEKMPIQRIYNYSCMAKETIKRSSEAFIGLFTDRLLDSMLKEKELESHMKMALEQKEFKVYLQPKYRSDGTQVEGAEALVRWVSPALGFISPGEFIPLFEKNGFIIPLDIYMLQEVCRQQKEWKDAGKELITISVNISRRHLLDRYLINDVLSIIDNYELPHNCIEIELTESAFFDDKTILIDTVNQLQEEGLLVSMDDFGSGYSSLNSLKDLPLDVIKLDGEFFKTTFNVERSETVIRDTIDMAKHLNMKIVAEGIETKEQVDFLHQIGCDLIQGYYFAKPMPISDFEKLMKWN